MEVAETERVFKAILLIDDTPQGVEGVSSRIARNITQNLTGDAAVDFNPIDHLSSSENLRNFARKLLQDFIYPVAQPYLSFEANPVIIPKKVKDRPDFVQFQLITPFSHITNSVVWLISYLEMSIA